MVVLWLYRELLISFLLGIFFCHGIVPAFRRRKRTDVFVWRQWLGFAVETTFTMRVWGSNKSSYSMVHCTQWASAMLQNSKRRVQFLEFTLYDWRNVARALFYFRCNGTKGHCRTCIKVCARPARCPARSIKSSRMLRPCISAPPLFAFLRFKYPFASLYLPLLRFFPWQPSRNSSSSPPRPSLPSMLSRLSSSRRPILKLDLCPLPSRNGWPWLPMQTSPMPLSWRAMAKMVRTGKIRHIWLITFFTNTID